MGVVEAQTEQDGFFFSLFGAAEGERGDWWVGELLPYVLKCSVMQRFEKNTLVLFGFGGNLPPVVKSRVG